MGRSQMPGCLSSLVPRWLSPRGLSYFRTKLANFTVSVLSNQKDLGGQQICPMGLMGRFIDCRAQVVLEVTILAVESR